MMPVLTSRISILFLFCIWVCASVRVEGTAKYTYGCVIDAGSSKSNLIIYRWIPVKSRSSVPQTDEIFSYKVKPGISYFGENMTGLEEYITDIVYQAKKNVPVGSHATTPIFLLATAGMRLLLQHRAYAVMETIRDTFSNSTISPFRFQDRQARILSGEEEGAFAWITVNYLRGLFGANSKMKSNGVLEMGGASTQIAFIPEGPILADKFPMTIGNKIYGLYVHSYLYYGTSAAQKWLKEYLARKDPNKTSIDNPCLLKGDTQTDTIYLRKITFRGTGDAAKCETLLQNLVYKSAPSRCYPKPCAVGPIYQPQVGTEKPFIVISSFVYAITALRVADKEGLFTSEDMRKSAQSYCSMSMPAAKNYTNQPNEYLSNYCFMGMYVPLLYTRAYGFPTNETRMKAVSKIDGKPTAWSLGALLYEVERFSSANPVIIKPNCPLNSTPPIHYSLHLHFALVLIWITSTLLTPDGALYSNNI